MNNYIRVRKENDSLVLETAIKTYYNKEKDLEIKLASMSHIAKKSFFKKMFSTLDSLETILYEGTGLGKISKSQKKSAYNKLDKEYEKSISEYAHAHNLYLQPKIIPHKKYGKHWKHCDISLDEEIKKAGKSDKDLKFMTGQIMNMKFFSEMAKTSPAKKEESLYIQAKIAKKMPVNNKVDIIINYRNNIVINDIKRLIKEKKIKKIGIMYGADHMPGISSFLKKQGFNLKSDEWVEYWKVKDLKKPPKKLINEAFKKLIEGAC